MARIKLTLLIFVALTLILNITAFAAEKILFSFEEDLEGWEIPDWTFEKQDYVADHMELSTIYANGGKSSLQLMANFPGGSWTAAYAEIQEYFDWTPYGIISADVYLSPTAPAGLRGKLILTVGEDWTWTEMSRNIALVPGEWTTLSADLTPGSSDWRRTTVTNSFRQDVRKLGIRIESNMKPAYQGPIYIDNIRLSEKEKVTPPT